MPQGPNPLVVAWSVYRSLRTVRTPGPFGTATSDHRFLTDALQMIAEGGTPALGRVENDLSVYLERQATIPPDELARDEALAYWLNLYNAGALALAGRALRAGENTVLGVPGGFRAPMVSVAGEGLSLDDIEHGKLRRFGDPRVHAALVCGSVSCPTLRGEPYTGPGLHRELDDQLRHFLDAGACSVDRSVGVVRLSRVFLWFGADFVRPDRMPTFLPVSRRRVFDSLIPWLDPDIVAWSRAAEPRIEFQPYDWGLRCVVR